MFRKAIVLVVTVILCTGGYGLICPQTGYAAPEYTCELEIANDTASEPCVFMTPKWQDNKGNIIYKSGGISAEKYTSDCNGKKILEKIASDANACKVIGGKNPVHVQMILFSPSASFLGDEMPEMPFLDCTDIAYEPDTSCQTEEKRLMDIYWDELDKYADQEIMDWDYVDIDFNAQEIETNPSRIIYMMGYPVHMYGECIGYNCESEGFGGDPYYVYKGHTDWVSFFPKLLPNEESALEMKKKFDVIDENMSGPDSGYVFPVIDLNEWDYLEGLLMTTSFMGGYLFQLIINPWCVDRKQCMNDPSLDVGSLRKTLVVSQNIDIKGDGIVVFRGVEMDFRPGGSLTIWGNTKVVFSDSVIKNANIIIKDRSVQGEQILVNHQIDLIFPTYSPLHLIYTEVINTIIDEASGAEEVIGHDLKLEIDGQYELMEGEGAPRPRHGWLVMSDFEGYPRYADLPDPDGWRRIDSEPTSMDIKLGLDETDPVKCELINGAYCRLPTSLNMEAYILVNVGEEAGRLVYLGGNKDDDAEKLCFRANVSDDGKVSYGYGYSDYFDGLADADQVSYGDKYCDGLVADMKGLKLYNGGYYDGYFLSGYAPEKQKVFKDGGWVDSDEYINSHYSDGYFLVYDKTNKKFKKLEFVYPELKKNPWEETCWNDKASEIDVCCTDPMMEKTDAKELVATDNVCRCKDGYNQVEKAGSYDVLGTVSKWCNPTEAVVTEIAEGLTGERIVRYEPGNGSAQIWYDDCGKERIAKEGHKECIPCPPDMYEPENLPGVCITLTKLCGPDDAYDANKCKPCGDENDFYVPEDDKTLGCKLCEWDEKVDFSVQKCVKLECGSSAVIVDHQCVPCATGMVAVNNECVPAPDEEEEPGLGGGDDEAEPGEGYGSGEDAAGESTPSEGYPADNGASPGDDSSAEKENSPESGDGASGPYKSAMKSRSGPQFQKSGMAASGTAAQRAGGGIGSGAEANANPSSNAEKNAFGCSVTPGHGSLSTILIFTILALGIRITRRVVMIN